MIAQYRRLVRQMPLPVKNRVKNSLFSLIMLPHYMNIRVLSRQPILVYQMGKVGSNSIFETLRQHGLYVIHTHVIYRDRPAVRSDIAPGRGFMVKKGRWLYQNVIHRDHPVKIITAVRDPIAVAVAHFFQNLDFHTGVDNALANLSLNQLLDCFNGSFIRPHLPAYYLWFEKQFNSILGVDIFEQPFPVDRGYVSFEHESMEIMILRLETDDTAKTRALRKFTGCDDIQLMNANIGDRKAYAERYRQFKQAVRVPQDLIDRAYTSQMATHFYTADEIEGFRAQWENQAMNGGQ